MATVKVVTRTRPFVCLDSELREKADAIRERDKHAEALVAHNSTKRLCVDLYRWGNRYQVWLFEYVQERVT